MGWWNDNLARINGRGGLTLGHDRDDGAGDVLYPYAKNDVFVTVSPGDMISTTLPALTQTSAGVFHRTLAAATTHTVVIPLQGGLFRAFVGDIHRVAPHGVKVNSLTLFYRVNTTTITSLSLKIYTVPNAVGAAIYTATEIVSTTAGATLTAAANIYGAMATVTTPTFNNVLNASIVGEAVVVVPGSSTVDLLQAVWGLSVALY